MAEILNNFLLQLSFTVGLVVAFGVGVWFLNKLFYKLMGGFGKAACIATGFIGTPVHEIGHAIFCKLFGHKIVEIKLYQPNGKDGVLGYVKHSYNKKNIFHQIGNFFIGVGPIVFGSGVLMLLMLVLVPELLEDLTDTMNLFALLNLSVFSLSSVSYLVEILWEIVVAFFSASSLSNPLWWLFMIPACSIALHMSLSIPDIKSSLIGFIFIGIILFLINIILYLVRIDIWVVTDLCLRISAFILNFLVISIILSLILVFVAGLVKGIKNIIKIKK